MKYSIQIHKPCNEPWDNMHPNSNGRHCDQCSKTVVDFTDWKQGDIVAYLQEQGTEKVCGRFKNEQLATVDTDTFVVSVARSRLPLYKKLAAIFLMAFGMIQMSCGTAPSHALAGDTTAIAPPVDTIQQKTEYHTMGMLPPAPLPPVEKKKRNHIAKPSVQNDTLATEPVMLKGDVILEPIYDQDTAVKKQKQ